MYISDGSEPVINTFTMKEFVMENEESTIEFVVELFPEGDNDDGEGMFEYCPSKELKPIIVFEGSTYGEQVKHQCSEARP